MSCSIPERPVSEAELCPQMTVLAVPGQVSLFFDFENFRIVDDARRSGGFYVLP